MIQAIALISEARRVSPGVTLLHAHTPEIAAASRPGQFVMVRCSDSYDPYLRRPFPLFSISTTSIGLLVRADEPGRRWLARQGVGQSIDVIGPLGQGFAIAPTTRHLLLAAEGILVGALAVVAAQATANGIAVTLLAGAPSAAATLPADLLPTAVEYRVATADGSRGEKGDVAALLPSTIQWADQVFAAGSPALYRSLAQAIARHRLRVENEFAQVWRLGTVGCGLGVCQCCAVETRRGMALSCHDGPVFLLREVETW